MKLGRLVDERLHAALQKLSGERLPLKTAYKLKGIIKKTREEFSKYEEVRKEAVQRDGEKNEDGTLKVDDRNQVNFSQEGMVAFAKELNELTAMDIEFPTITVEELGNSVTLSVEDLEALEDVVIE